MSDTEAVTQHRLYRLNLFTEIMKTYSPKKGDIKREWHIIDAEGKTLGRISTKIADILRGKNKPIFSPHMDCGDYVVVINAKDIKLTGDKLTKKTYHRHTRYPGGLKEISAGKLLLQKPERVLEKAVYGMIPSTKIKKDILKKLKIYAGSEHKHSAQNPKPLEL
jgi:large subunit ribosomal protein L13